MSVKARIGRLERHRRQSASGAFNHLTDAELVARALKLAEELELAGSLDAEMIKEMESSGLWPVYPERARQAS